ncbi:MAG: amidohydrolase family protein [Oscillospiraceae bacterium]|nr:amidohydrolase family protein [Oscillospiraceae bacterium]
MLVLKNCKFVPFLTEGVDFETGDVFVENGRIEKILPAGSEYPADANVFNLAGKTLLPGLIDLHVHLFYEVMSDIFVGNSAPQPTTTLNAFRYAEELLNDGYTTIRDVGDLHCRAALYVKKMIESGKVDGPRITTSGPIISSNWTNLDSLDIYACGSDGFRDAVRKNFANGSDFIKLYGSGSLLLPSNEPGYPILESDEIEAACLVAKRNSSYVSVHAHGPTAIDMCVKAGVHTIEHASMITEDTLKYIDDNNLDTALVYTMFAIDEVLEEPESYNGQRMNALIDWIKSSLLNAYHNHKNILIGWGTDVGLKLYKTDPMREFRLRKEMLEMSNEDILKQATINSAKIIYQDDKIGSIKEGKFADFVVVDGDPVEDLSVMYRIPEHVIKGGKIIR